MNPASSPEEIIFTAALALPPAQRAAHVAAACAGDASLQRRVEALLRAHESAASLLQDSPGQAIRTSSVRPHAEEQPGTMIDRYKLLQKIGEGGCGVVYMAEQEEPVRRRVALKVIKLGMDTKEVVARFGAERQALALMDHPNIARVFDGGTTTTGRPYFVMELVRGVPITRYCDDNNLSTERRLELFTAVCQAVQHAHQKGIIHRDLKPSNVLVTENDGVPVPKVIDFGIAKATQGRLTDATLFTAFEQFIGTPAYMSPEQAAMTSLDVDTRSDIYSLGVLLYELLTGRPPFEPQELVKAGFDEMRRRIREVEPPRPSARLSTLTEADRTTVAKLRGIAAADLTTALAGDLDWIVMRCLEKDRTRRYESASALALDLQHYRDDQPVAARPPSKAYRLQKFVARNKLAVGAGTAVAFALIAGLVTSILAYYNEKAAHRFAVETSQALQKAMAEAKSAQSTRGDALRQEAEKSIYAIQLMQVLVNRTSTTALSAEDKAQILQVVDDAVQRIRHEPQIRASTRLVLLDSAGAIFVDFGEFARAESILQQAYMSRRMLLGVEHPETQATRQKLDEVLRRQGKPPATMGQPGTAQSTQVKARPNMDFIPMSHARELRLKGRYAEADAEMWEAIEYYRRRNPVPSMYVLKQMAQLHLAAGDLQGPRLLALHLLEENRQAYGWFRSGFVAGLSIDSPVGSFYAHTLLGLISLREGNRKAAIEHLHRSADGIIIGGFVYDDFNFNAPDVQLAAELLALNEQTAVLEFLQRVRRTYVDALDTRSRGFFFNVSWEDYYENSAKARIHAEKLDGWRQEILAGNVPDDWQKMLEADRPATAVAPVQLRSMEPLLAELPRLHSGWSGILPPCLLLCLGWIAVGVGAWQRTTITVPAARRLVSLAAVRILGCVLFAGTFFVEGYVANGTIIYLLTVASWWLLWSMLQYLAPELVTRREAMVFRLLAWASILIPVSIMVVIYLIKDDWVLRVMGIGLLLTCLAVLGMVLSVCGLYVFRLRKWKSSDSLRPLKVALLLSIPLVLLHAFNGVTSAFSYELYPARGVYLLWADAFSPWVLSAGLFLSKASQSTAVSPATTA